MEYLLESKTKAVIMEFYLNGFTLRGKGYGTVCMNEIAHQLGKKGVTMITAPMGYELAPLGYTGMTSTMSFLPGFIKSRVYGQRGRGSGDEDH